MSLIVFLAYPENLPVVSNIFNDVLHSIDQDNVVMNNNDEMSNLIQILNIDLNNLLKLKRRTATATARSILKYTFPSPTANFKLTDMDKTLADAIVRKSKLFYFFN